MQPYFDNKVIKSLQKMKSRKKIQICRSLNITTKQPTLNLFGKAQYSYIPMQNFKWKNVGQTKSSIQILDKILTITQNIL